MAKRKTAKIPAGGLVRVQEGVMMPEFDGLCIGGWEGTVVEITGKGDAQKVIIEWNAQAQEQMPQTYRDHCDAQGLYHGMACLPFATVEVVD